MAGNLMEFQFKSSIDRMMKRSAYKRVGGYGRIVDRIKIGIALWNFEEGVRVGVCN